VDPGRLADEEDRAMVSGRLDEELARIRVFFVTHQFDFADSFRRQRPHDTLFLRAPRQPGGQRTYRLTVAEPLPTSYGQDIYYRIGGWLGEPAGSR
jgi:hypothetical protein